MSTLTLDGKATAPIRLSSAARQTLCASQHSLCFRSGSFKDLSIGAAVLRRRFVPLHLSGRTDAESETGVKLHNIRRTCARHPILAGARVHVSIGACGHAISTMQPAPGRMVNRNP